MKLTMECSIAGGISFQLDVTPTMTVSQLLAMKSWLGVEGDDWHLRKLDWCGEPDDLLDDLEATLDSCRLENGDRVRLEPGKLTPKVGGQPVQVGGHCSPVRLNVKWRFAEERNETRVFAKDTLISQVRSSLCSSASSADLEKGHVLLWLESSEEFCGDECTDRILTTEDDMMSLAQLDITDGQTLLVTSSAASENGCEREQEEGHCLLRNEDYTTENVTTDLREWVSASIEYSNKTMMKLTMECSIAGGISLQLDVTPTMTVSQLLAMKSWLGVEGDDWHLRKLDWCGEPDDLLDDLEATLDSCRLENGDRVRLEPGKLTPKGFLRIAVWKYPVPPETVLSQGHNGSSNAIFASYRAVVGELVISADKSLESLKRDILALTSVTPHWPWERQRVRMIDGGDGRPTRVLRMHAQSLKALNLTQDCELAIQYLNHAEDLDRNSILLNVRVLRTAQSRRYHGPFELTWCTSRGSDAASLRHAVATHLSMLPEHVCLAKRRPDKNDWILIIGRSGEGKSKKTTGKCKSKRNGSLKMAPYHIQDGDEIGVKDLRLHWSDDDDFGAEEDDIIAKGVHNKPVAIVRPNVSSNVSSQSSRSCKGEGEERPLRIHVANFS